MVATALLPNFNVTFVLSFPTQNCLRAIKSSAPIHFPSLYLRHPIDTCLLCSQCDSVHACWFLFLIVTILSTMPSIAIRSSTVVIKSSSNCCIGRSPPSPDALPTRPMSSPLGQTSNTMLTDPIPSWTTKDAEELQAIFEEGFEAETKDAKPTAMDKPVGNFKLKAISQGDVFDSEEELDAIQPKKSSSTLRAVTEKLKKHLSRDSGLRKRYSRSSIGTTEEEIERRAELRRIRQRRIEEELSHESIYDDDAKSLSTIPINTPLQMSTTPGTPLPLPTATPPLLPCPTLVLPELSPVNT